MPKSKKPFKKAYLEITSQCNLDCSFCPKTSRPPKFITVGQFDYLLGQVQPLTNFVYLHLMGEPLLHPQLDRLLELCAQRGLKVSLTTNGTLLHRWQQQLLQSPALYRVSISLHSFEANRTGQSLEEYLSKALEFCRAGPHLLCAAPVEQRQRRTQGRKPAQCGHLRAGTPLFLPSGGPAKAAGKQGKHPAVPAGLS